MLTKRQNLIETIRGGNPDRFVKQYEFLNMIMEIPLGVEFNYGQTWKDLERPLGHNLAVARRSTWHVSCAWQRPQSN